MKSYYDIPKQFTALDKARFVILPAPYEQTTTFITGTGKGPAALLDASCQVELYDEETGVEPYRLGIHSAPPIKFGAARDAKAVKIMDAATRKYLKPGRLLAVIGGEHSITAGIVPAYAKAFKNLSILHIDAHPDLRDSYEGSKLNHACAAARMIEHAPVVQVAVRAWCVDQAEFMKKAVARKINGKKALTMFPAHEIMRKSGWIPKVVSALTENVYLTLDLDGLDPSVIPAVGTPEPGGLGWHQTLDLLKAVVNSKNIVGMDLVELCPKRGEIIGDFAAARLLHKIFAYIAAKD